MSMCAIPGCGKVVKPEMLMCLAHWRQVPRYEQRQVWDTWRNVRRDPETYRVARDAAIEIVVKKTGGVAQGGLFDG